jgi:hypothetical protein
VSETAQQADSRPAPPSTGRPAPLHLALPLFFVAFSPILFYGSLFRNAIDIPFYDDYHAVLDFLNRMAVLDGFSAKLTYFLAAQHNEYKLYFLHAVAWLQWSLFGHTDFFVLSILGDLFVLLLAVLLWKMFLPKRKDLASRLVLFIPVSWLLFQFQYWETLNWSMAILQNVPVLLFSLGSIYFLVKGTRPAFWAALASFILAVAASGSGFLLIPIGLSILALNRRYFHIAVWLLASAACIAAYAFRYTPRSAPSAPYQAAASNSHHFNPAYVLAFIGSAASFPFKSGSFVLGTLLCLFFVYMARRGYIRKNPLVSWCVLFLLITAIAVAGLRSGLGVEQAVASRYTIYSALFLIFAWFAIVEEFLQSRPASLLKNDVLLCAVLLTIPFSLAMDLEGWIQIERRENALIKAMATYEHSTSAGNPAGPSPPLFNEPSDPVTETFNRQSRPILAESIRLGIYRPPPF